MFYVKKNIEQQEITSMKFIPVNKIARRMYKIDWHVKLQRKLASN